MMTLNELIRTKRKEILEIGAKYGIIAVRLFGSVARGTASLDSDADFLVRVEPGRSLLDLIAFAQDIEELLGRKVDVVTEEGISPYLKERILSEAVPL